MTTLDVILASEYSTPNIRQWEKLYKPAVAELAQLRADLQAAQERIKEFESGDLVSALLEANQTQAGIIIEQARQLDEARKILHDYESPEDTISFAMRELACIIPADETIWHTWLLRQADIIDNWLAANPAPEAEQQP